MPKRKRKNSESQKKRRFLENQVVNSDDEEGEWEVAKILEEKLTDEGAMVHVLWTAGDKTWEPVSEFANVKQYLDFRIEEKAKDVAQPQEPLKLEQKAAFFDSEARKKFKKVSNYVGVAWHEKSKKWGSYVQYKLEFVFVGEYPTELKAAEASNDKCDELCIPRSNLSIPDKKVKTCTHKPTKQGHRGESLYCDVCKEPQLQNSVVIGCRQCDWDECTECYKIVKSKGSKMTLKQCRKFLKQRGVPYSRRCSALGLKEMVWNVWKTSHPYILGSSVMAKYRDGRFYEAEIVEIMLEESPKLFKVKWKDDTQSDLWKSAEEIVPTIDYDSDSDDEDYSQKPEFQNVFFQEGQYVGRFMFQGQKFSSSSVPSPRLAAIEVNELCARLGIPPKNVIPPISSIKSEPTHEMEEIKDDDIDVPEPKLDDPTFRAHNYMDDVSDDQDDTDDSDYKIEDEGRRKQLVNRMAQPPTPEKAKMKFSSHKGVTWDPRSSRWVAVCFHMGSDIKLGYFKAELEAVDAINKKCKQLHIQKQCVEGEERFKGVKQTKSGRYEAQVYNGKTIYIGTFDSAIEAAWAINKKCADMGIELKNPDVRPPPRDSPYFINKQRFHCPFGCSSSYKTLGSLKRHLTINKKSNGCPILNKQNVLLSVAEVNEIAQNVNSGGNVYVGSAAKMKIDKVTPVKEENKGSSIEEDSDSDLSSEEANPAPEKEQRRPKTRGMSVYSGVSKQRARTGVRWRGQVFIGSKRHECGRYDTEIEAARAVNEKCDELGIPRKNPDVPDANPKTKKVPPATNPSRKRKATSFETPPRKKRRQQTPPPRRPPPLENDSPTGCGGLKSGTFVNGFTEGMIVRMHEKYVKKFGIVERISGSTIKVQRFDGITSEGNVSKFCKSNRAELVAFKKSEELRLKTEEPKLESRLRKEKKELNELKKVLERNRAEQARELANLEQKAKAADKTWKHNKQALAKKLLEIDEVEQKLKNARHMRSALKKKHKEGKESLAQLQGRNTKVIEKRKAVIDRKTEAKQKAQSALDDWDLKHESQKEFLEKAKMFLASKE